MLMLKNIRIPNRGENNPGVSAQPDRTAGFARQGD
jgi:hypothetical protein